MEEKKAMDMGLYESRSYLGCLDEGFKLPTRHILSLLKFTWPSLVVCALVAALWGCFFNQLSVALAQWWAATEPVILSFPLLTCIFLVLFTIFAAGFYTGNILVTVTQFTASGNVWALPKVGKCRHEIIVTSFRAMAYLLVGLAVVAVVMVPLTLWANPGKVWLMVIFAVLWLVWAVPYSMVGVDYLLGQGNGFFSSLKRMKEGYQYWGAFFIVLFCGGLVVCLLSLVSWMPSGILAYAGHESMLGVLEGDPSDLPSYVPALVVVFFMLAAVIVGMFGWLILFPMSYLYGSIVSRKKEKDSFEEEERRLSKA